MLSSWKENTKIYVISVAGVGKRAVAVEFALWLKEVLPFRYSLGSLVKELFLLFGCEGGNQTMLDAYRRCQGAGPRHLSNSVPLFRVEARKEAIQHQEPTKLARFPFST
jgi:hypothetical protein